MNKFLRVIFILLILAMLSAAIIQIFQPQLLGALWSSALMAERNRLLESGYSDVTTCRQHEV